MAQKNRSTAWEDAPGPERPGAPVCLQTTDPTPAAAAEFGLLLRESDYRAQASYQQAYDLARSAVGENEHGLRSEFARLVQAAGLMHGSLAER